MLTAEGEQLRIKSITYEKLSKPVKVYNFEVEDWHTYYVGEEEVLVHNWCMEGMPDGKTSTSSNDKVYFGQQAVSPNFSPQGTFEGASIQSVADRLASGELSADNLPIEYIVRDGKMITMNNRSLTALSKANMKPTILIDITGDVANEAKLTQRLSEMGGQPSESILIRKIGEIVHLPN